MLKGPEYTPPMGERRRIEALITLELYGGEPEHTLDERLPPSDPRADEPNRHGEY